MKNLNLGMNIILLSLFASVVQYLMGYVNVFSVLTATIFIIGILFINYSFFYSLNRYMKNRFLSFIFLLFIYILYFSLRLNLLDFSFSVGDASDYLWSGVSSNINGDDTGWFLPLTASVIGTFSYIISIEYISFVNVLMQLIGLPILYFIFKEFKINFYIRLLILIVYTINPLSIWFSKTTFSEPIWQLLLIFFIYFATKFLEYKYLKIGNIFGLTLTIILLVFSRGSSIFLLPLLFLLLYFHYLKHNNRQIFSLLLLFLFLFLSSFYYILQIRMGYIIGWQFSQIIPTITADKLMLILIILSLFSYIIGLTMIRYSKRINYKLIIFYLLLVLKITIAYFFSLKYNDYTFLYQLILKEFSFMNAHFGFICSLLILFGLLIVIYKSLKGNVKYLNILAFYIFLSIPLEKMEVSVDKVHDLFLYWHRYYFSEVFLMHLLLLAISLSFLVDVFKCNTFFRKKSMYFIVIASILLSFSQFNNQYFRNVVENRYLSGSSNYYGWIKRVVNSKKLIVLYDKEIHYSKYDFKHLTSKGLYSLGFDVKFIPFHKSNVNINKYLEINKITNERRNLVIVSNQPIKNLLQQTYFDSFYFNIKYIQHINKGNIKNMPVYAVYYDINAIKNNKDISRIGTRINFCDHIWTSSNSSIINLNFMLRNSFIIKLATKGLNPNKENLQLLNPKLSVNGKKIKFLKYKDNNYYFKIPNSLNLIKSINIKSNTFNPKKIGINDDNRELGMDIKFIEIIKEIPK